MDILIDPKLDDLVGITEKELSVERLYGWALRNDCGAVVMFSGTVRNSSGTREGVTGLTYEAYESVALERMRSLIDEMRKRFGPLGKVGILHRVGSLSIMESTVVVVVSAPHRGGAFEAARFGIDSLKTSVPIWKKEQWKDGSDWGLNAVPVGDLGA